MTESETGEPALALHPMGARPAQDLNYGFENEGHKEAMVQRQPRGHRLLWLLGVLLLVGTAVGAAWALNHGSAGPETTSTPADSLPPGIVALGMVDNDPEILKLRSPLAGEVLEIASEGKLLKKGDPLLRLDSRTATFLLQQADAALDNARKQLEMAKILPEKHRLDIQSQEKVILAGEKKAKALKHEVESNREMRDTKLINQRVLDTAQAVYDSAEALVARERIKLLQLKLAKPELDVARAQSDVADKEALRNQAKLALERCDLLAPQDGKVLRVFVHRGEWIAPDAKFPALQFCPTGKRIIRAEVLQEWASLVEKGQKVAIEDDTRSGPKWEGTVSQVSDWITQKREVMLEPFMVNDVRTLECLIDVAPGGAPLRIGQRVRVTIQQGK